MRKLLLALCLLPSLAWAQTAYESHVTNLYAPTVFYYDTETSGTTLTNHGSAGSGYNMATGNTPTLNQSGVTASRGGAIQFTAASSQYASVNKNDTGTGPGDIANGAGKTFECWVNASAFGARFMAAATAETGDANVWLLAISAGNKALINFYQTASTSVRYQGLGGTSLSTNTWYLLTGTWVLGTTTSTIYVNGVSDGASSTDLGGVGPAAVQWFEQGRTIQTAILYTSGKQQDCAIYGSASSAANILDRYNFGVLAGNGLAWPFLTKRPEIPNFRNDGWLDKVKSRGYLTGHFTPKAMVPQYFTLGYLPMTILPRGDIR